MTDDPTTPTTSSSPTNGETGTEHETHHEAKRAGRWVRDAVIPAWIAIAALLCLGGLFAGIIARIEDSRHDAQAQDRVQTAATCRTQNEFRTFLGNFLESQGAGADFGFDDVPGYLDLPVEMRIYLLNLNDLVFQNRDEAKRAAAEYRRDFPVVECPPANGDAD